MREPEALTGVAEFHKLFNMPVLDKPQIPSEKRCELRVELIREELQELREGIKNKDLVEIADALADLQYVLSGAVLEFGLGDKFTALFNEVQRSNMSKACDTEEEAWETIRSYKEKGQEGIAVRKGNKYIVFRSEDKKVLKSIGYSPANLKSILEK